MVLHKHCSTVHALKAGEGAPVPLDQDAELRSVYITKPLDETVFALTHLLRENHLDITPDEVEDVFQSVVLW